MKLHFESKDITEIFIIALIVISGSVLLTGCLLTPIYGNPMLYEFDDKCVENLSKYDKEPFEVYVKEANKCTKVKGRFQDLKKSGRL